VVNIDGGRQLHPQLGAVVQASDSSSQREVEHMAATSPRLVREMQVPSDHLDAIERVRKAEANHRPGHVVEIGNPLLPECLSERRVRRSLFRDRADAYVLEVSIDAHRDRTLRARQAMPDRLPKRVKSDTSVQLHGWPRRERHDYRVRRPGRARYMTQGAVAVRLQRLAIDDYQLTVKPVQCPEPQITMLEELGQRHVTIKGATEQSFDG
jgi:hypothetical protein